jgi:protein-tyrosine phosphatase
MKTVLFVCTGNIFRSMTAEYAFRAQNKDASVQSASAGIEANQQVMYPPVKKRVIELGIDPSAHVQRKLTQEMLDGVDLPVAMGVDHQDFIREQFGCEVPLFNRVALGKDEPIKDIWEIVPNWDTDESGREKYALYVVDTIWNTMPKFMANMNGFMKNR